MNNNAEYGYLRNHISATLLGSYKGLVARDYWLEPVLFLSFIFRFFPFFIVWEIFSIAQLGCLN